MVRIHRKYGKAHQAADWLVEDDLQFLKHHQGNAMDFFRGGASDLSCRIFGDRSYGGSFPAKTGSMLIVGCGRAYGHVTGSPPIDEHLDLITQASIDLQGSILMEHLPHSSYPHKIKTLDINEEMRPDICGDFFQLIKTHSFNVYDVVFFEGFPLMTYITRSVKVLDVDQLQLLAAKVSSMLYDGGEFWYLGGILQKHIEAFNHAFISRSFETGYAFQQTLDVSSPRGGFCFVAKKSKGTPLESSSENSGGKG